MAGRVIKFRHLATAFQALDIPISEPVLVHASLSSFGQVEGGAESVVGALSYCFDTLVMPSFTYKTMIVPGVGPPDNGITYGSPDANLMTEFYDPLMPVDRLMGAIPEALRKHPRAARSDHPILSFVGMNADHFLEQQTLDEPLGPIGKMAGANGWVLLIGVNHTVNTSIHYAERLAGRSQFVRWALTEDGVVACPGFPGCSDGFERIMERLGTPGGLGRLENALLRAYRLADLIDVARRWVEDEPLALLCERPACERCQQVRKNEGKNLL